MKTLAIETSTDWASIACAEGETVTAHCAFDGRRTLSAELASRVGTLVREAGIPDRIVVGVGPGSYAGVRVAISTALGLSTVWGCGLWGIPSVAALACEEGRFQVIGDARRGSWYYAEVHGGECIRGPWLAASEEELRRWLGEGTGAVWSSDSCALEGYAIQRTAPDARVLCLLAARRIGVVMDGDLEPLYLREATITQPKS